MSLGLEQLDLGLSSALWALPGSGGEHFLFTLDGDEGQHQHTGLVCGLPGGFHGSFAPLAYSLYAGSK